MAKRPPKPDGQERIPRFKATKLPSFASAVESARKLIDDDGKSLKVGTIQKELFVDDRSFAIVRGANVENALELALLGFLTIHKGERRNLFKSEGPLGTFSKKITMGYALEVFGPVTKKNLEIIRHVRNLFAHAKSPIDFHTEEVQKLCDFLMLPPKVQSKNIATAAERAEEEEKIKNWSPYRLVFLHSCFVTEMSLLRLGIIKRNITIKDLGGTVSPMPDFRLVFDDSLP